MVKKVGLADVRALYTDTTKAPRQLLEFAAQNNVPLTHDGIFRMLNNDKLLEQGKFYSLDNVEAIMLELKKSNDPNGLPVSALSKKWQTKLATLAAGQDKKLTAHELLSYMYDTEQGAYVGVYKGADADTIKHADRPFFINVDRLSTIARDVAKLSGEVTPWDFDCPTTIVDPKYQRICYMPEQHATLATTYYADGSDLQYRMKVPVVTSAELKQIEPPPAGLVKDSPEAKEYEAKINGLENALKKFPDYASWKQLLADRNAAPAALQALYSAQQDQLYALMRKRMERTDLFSNEIPRDQACAFGPEPRFPGASAIVTDYELGNQVWRTSDEYLASNGQDDFIYDMGHLKACDSKSNTEASFESCLLANNSPQYGTVNRQGYRALEELIRKSEVKYGDAMFTIVDMYLDEARKPVRDLDKNWKRWTLGSPGVHKVVLDENGKVFIDPVTQKALLNPTLTAGELTAKYGQRLRLKDVKSLPVPSHRGVHALWQPFAKGKRSVTTWVVPNSGKVPTKADGYTPLINSDYAPGLPVEKTGWLVKPTDFQSMAGIDLNRFIDDEEERAIESELARPQ